MTDMEDAIRRALQSQPTAERSDELLTTVQRKVSHRRNMRAAAAAAAVAAVIAGGGVAAASLKDAGSGSTGQAASQGGDHGVPWLNKPAAAAPDHEQEPATPSAKWAPCQPDQLTAGVGDAVPGAGTTTQFITLTNSSQHGCTLTGHPAEVTGIKSGGAQTSLHPSQEDGRSYGMTTPANLAAGQTAQFGVTYTALCSDAQSGKKNRYESLKFSVGNGAPLSVTLPADQRLNLVCGAPGVTTFGLSADTTTTSSPLDVLTATSTMPDAVTAGTIVTYQVTLTNPTDSDVTMDPCPSYSEFLSDLGTAPASATVSYQLNCAAAPTVPARSSVTFDMQVPAPSAAGAAKFGWKIPGTVIETGGGVTVTAH